MAFDVADGVLDSVDFLGVLVGNFDIELFLGSHDEFDDVEAVSAEVVDEGGIWLDFFVQNPQAIRDYTLDSLKNIVSGHLCVLRWLVLRIFYTLFLYLSITQFQAKIKLSSLIILSMQITAIKATNMEMTEAIEAYVREKLEVVDKLMIDFRPEPEAAVELGKTSTHHANGPFFFAEITMTVPSNVLRARTEAEDLYEAIDLMKDDLRRQVVDIKEKMVDAHHEPRPDKV